MADLFDVSTDNIGLHIKNIFSSGELDMATTEEYSVVQQEGNRKVKRRIKFYNLDMITSVGYRVNSKKGILFRKWASNILKKYLVEGYAVNEKRLSHLEKQINLISIASRLDEKLINDEGNKILETIISYNKALTLLDDYDHQIMSKSDGTLGCYRITCFLTWIVVDILKFQVFNFCYD